MQFGLAGDLSQSRIAHEAGFDFLEVNVQSFLAPLESEQAFTERLFVAQNSPIPVVSANCLLPAHLKCVGPNFSLVHLQEYMTIACARAARTGIKILVFGSGGSRMVPDAFDRKKGVEQLRDFALLAAEIAAAAGIVLVIEPLNKRECNIFNSINECGLFVTHADHPALRLLVDSYHFWTDDNDMTALLQYAGLLHHIHVATTPSRKAPGTEPSDFITFFKTIKKNGFDGTVTFEGGWDTLQELVEAVTTVKDAWQKQ